MTKKVKFELEYVLRTSPKVLDKALTTPDGLSEWFADNVKVNDGVFTFFWDGSEEMARLIAKKNGEGIKWQWINDEEDGIDTFFEMKYTIDQMTKAVILTVSDFAEQDEMDEVKRLWDSQIITLKRYIGA
jgi:uncharacterized protein YndB with AHSA1/START domain